MKKDRHITRCDLRIPNDLYLEIEKIAQTQGARENQRTGKTIVTPTILGLIRAGIDAFKSEYLPPIPANYQIHSEPLLSDNYQILDRVIGGHIETAIAPVLAQLENITKLIENRPENTPVKIDSKGSGEISMGNESKEKLNAPQGAPSDIGGDEEQKPEGGGKFGAGLTQSELSERIGVHRRNKSVATWRGMGDDVLAAKTKKRDPDGLAWEYRGGKYFPISPEGDPL